MSHDPPSRLHRVLGVRAAAVVGVGAMLGTGAFAVWTPALSLAGGALLVALVLAALVAALNATSTAALARDLPEAGGAYAYGREFLGRPAGLVAGYTFVVGKSASAGAAALTIGAYTWPGHERLVAVAAVLVALGLDLRGAVKSMRVTAVLIAIVVLSVLILAMAWAFGSESGGSAPAGSLDYSGSVSVLAAAGLLFVAFAGYARITVLAEEVRDPRRTIPLAMLASFAIVVVVYVVIAVIVLAAARSGVTLTAAPLEAIAHASGWVGVPLLMRVAAVLAAGAVLLSLLAGIGRTLFAMADRGDAPRGLAAISVRRVPQRAEVLAAIVALAVVAVGGIGVALALSAAAILTYYGVAHCAVLARWRRGAQSGALALVATLGLLGCLVVVVGIVISVLAAGALALAGG